ncbi:MAG: prepilin-type N-terminal cleavage/methylation domain-containing protein [Candidatus Peregrinibacteria bacterium]
MKEKSLKSALNHGFTLIELMIVIVILGVLMGTILPRLTGGQARARDLARRADLNTIAQAMETHFDDFGQYPGTAGQTYCLDGGDADDVSGTIENYLRGGVPTPPAGQTTILLGLTADNGCQDSYFYAPLENRGIANTGYILATDVETWQNANADGSAAPLNTALAATTTVDDLEDALLDITDVNEGGTPLLETADDTATNTIFFILR